jgi:hypothetical protein
VRIHADAVLPYERSEVFRAYRDELAQFTNYLPDVRAIEVVSRVESGTITELHNVWHGGGEIPLPLVRWVGEDRLSWDDFARWDPERWCVDWKIRTHLFSEGIECTGQNRFLDLGHGRTRLEVEGSISIDIHRIQAVPSFLAGSIAKTLERFIVRQVAHNVTSISDVLEQHLGAPRVGSPVGVG